MLKYNKIFRTVNLVRQSHYFQNIRHFANPSGPKQNRAGSDGEDPYQDYFKMRSEEMPVVTTEMAQDAVDHENISMHEEEGQYMSLREEMILDDLKCDGCGVTLQYENNDKIGFLPKIKVAQHYQKQEELKRDRNEGVSKVMLGDGLSNTNK